MFKTPILWTIASNTFRESIRDKILYNIVFLTIGLVGISILLGQWSVFDRAHVIKSITLSVLSLSGLLISIFVGVSLVQKEIQRRTVLVLLSKPIHRWQFLMGKYFGLLAVVLVQLLILTAVFYLILWYTDSDPRLGLLRAVYLVFWEMTLVVSFAVLFASFSTPVLSSLFTLGLYISGHLSQHVLEHVRFVAAVSGEEFVQQNIKVMEFAAEWAYRILPALHRYQIGQIAVHDLALPSGYLLFSTLYAIGYAGILLTIATWWFSRRDFL